MIAQQDIIFPDQWINADKFEQTLRQASTNLFSSQGKITFRIPSSCKVMVDAAVRLLSLANQDVFADFRLIVKATWYRLSSLIMVLAY